MCYVTIHDTVALRTLISLIHTPCMCIYRGWCTYKFDACVKYTFLVFWSLGSNDTSIFMERCVITYTRLHVLHNFEVLYSVNFYNGCIRYPTAVVSTESVHEYCLLIFRLRDAFVNNLYWCYPCKPTKKIYYPAGGFKKSEEPSSCVVRIKYIMCFFCSLLCFCQTLCIYYI